MQRKREYVILISFFNMNLTVCYCLVRRITSSIKCFQNILQWSWPSRKLALIQGNFFSYFMIVLNCLSSLSLTGIYDKHQICHYILHHTYTFTRFQSIEKRIYVCVCVYLYINRNRDKTHLSLSSSFSKVCVCREKKRIHTMSITSKLNWFEDDEVIPINSCSMYVCNVKE
jgi:hypothetical protein